jgi:hypothetical protein
VKSAAKEALSGGKPCWDDCFGESIRNTWLFMDPEIRDQGRCSLAAEALRSWGILHLRATGVSMLPTLWPGDVLTVHSLSPEQVELGEIVLYMRQGRFFIHRVTRRNFTLQETCLITRGDCMSEDDPPVRRSELMGTVTEVQRSGSAFRPARRLSSLRRFVAFMLCHWSLFRRGALRVWNYLHAGDAQADATVVRAA